MGYTPKPPKTTSPQLPLLYELHSQLGPFPSNNYYITQFNKIPNTVQVDDVKDVSLEEFTAFVEGRGFQPLHKKFDNHYTRTSVQPTRAVFINQLEQTLISVVVMYQDDNPTKYTFDCGVYYSDRALIKEIEEYLLKNVSTGEAKNKISLIVKGYDGLCARSFDVKVEEFDVALHYGEEFVPIYNSIIGHLKTPSNKGIVLFHGKPGCGKTSLIKLMSKHVDKEVIFIPPYLVESISSPDFIPFLLEHPNSILVVEDAERVLLNRDSGEGSSQGVSSLLNIGDGILADCLNIQVICTFNTSRGNIDEALLRKGRLIAEYEFKELSVEDSNKLLQHLGKDTVADKPMRLSDIYGADQKQIKSAEEKSQKGIGFLANR